MLGTALCWVFKLLSNKCWPLFFIGYRLMGKGREASRCLIELFLPLSLMCAKGGSTIFFNPERGGSSIFFCWFRGGSVIFFHIFVIFPNDESIFLLLGPLDRCVPLAEYSCIDVFIWLCYGCGGIFSNAAIEFAQSWDVKCHIELIQVLVLQSEIQMQNY